MPAPSSSGRKQHMTAEVLEENAPASRLNAGRILLLTPPAIVLLLLLIIPILNILDQSFRTFQAGRVGAVAGGGRTLQNYLELLDSAYFYYFVETFRISFIGTVISVVLAFPIAYLITRLRSQFLRGVVAGGLIGIISVSTLVRVYALLLTFGAVGFGRPLSSLLGVTMSSSEYTEFMVLLGLVYFHTPISVLILIGSIQAINPRLIEAAQSLGAPRWKSHLSVTIPLALPGIGAAFVISFAVCVSAFVIPLILGAGRVQFVSNLIYSRFSVVSNYPSGSAISIVLLITAVLLVIILPWIFSKIFAKSPIFARVEK
jgi:ABC-type spermidine/putrescine transport system permease subunit I